MIFILKYNMGFWKDLINSSNAQSSKRFITLVVAAHFILSSFLILFFILYFILGTPKGIVEPSLLSALKYILEYDFYIILSGLGFIASENVTQMFISRNTSTTPTQQSSEQQPGAEPLPQE